MHVDDDASWPVRYYRSANTVKLIHAPADTRLQEPPKTANGRTTTMMCSMATGTSEASLCAAHEYFDRGQSRD